MSEKSRYQNKIFFDYCDSVGFFDESASRRFRTEFRDLGQRQLIIELAKYLEYLTASDYYDLSNRFYMGWLSRQRESPTHMTSSSSKIPASARDSYLESTRRTSNPTLRDAHEKSHQAEAFLSNRTTDRNWLSDGSHEEKEIEQFYNSNSKKSSKRSTSRQGPCVQNQPQENIPGSSSKQLFETPSSKKLDKLYNLYSKLEKKLANDSTKSARGLNDDSPYKPKSGGRGRSPLISPRTKRCDQLYEDYFTQNESKALKWHMARLKELNECTFVPQTNPLTQNKALSEHLKTPVFDRLSQIKPLKSSLQQQSSENRKLQGATFSPDIRKSQAAFATARDNRSPEARKAEAAARLYEKAQLKQRNLVLKRIISHEKELKNCTFQPKLQTPTHDKKAIRQNLDIHVDRMHSEAGRRKRELIKKEGELRDKEMEECTFTPASHTSRYRSKSRSTSRRRNIDPFARLYEEARTRQQLEKEFEREMRARDSARNKSSERMNRSRSYVDSVVRRHYSIDASGDFRQPYAAVSQFKDWETSETPAFDRLYNERIRKEEKRKQLEVKLMAEQGITFHPKSMTKSYRPSLSARSRQESPN